MTFYILSKAHHATKQRLNQHNHTLYTNRNKTMSLISLAIIGKDNEPLYLRDFQLVPQDTEDEIKEETNEEKKEDDFFGFFNCNKLAGESSSLRHQVGFMI